MADHGCPYCPPAHDDGPFNLEHVIPAKLGGTLEIRTHRSCNEQSAAAVDNPLMSDPDVELLRGLSGVRNTRRGGQPKGAQFRGDLADAAPALMRAGVDGVEIVQVGAGTPEASGDGRFTFTLGPGANLAERAEKMLARIRAENPGKTVTLIAQEARRSDVSVQRSWGMRPDVWPRFAAKVALGVLSLTMSDGWRGSEGWLSLMALFRLGKVIGNASGLGLSVLPSTLTDDPENSFWRNLYPWEHAIVLQTAPDMVVVTLVLFGELRYDLKIATPIQPGTPRVWLCDFREKLPLTFASVSAFAAAVTERHAMFGEVGWLRHDRPRRRLLGPTFYARLSESPIERTRPSA